MDSESFNSRNESDEDHGSEQKSKSKTRRMKRTILR